MGVLKQSLRRRRVPSLDLIDAETARFVAPDQIRARFEAVGVLEHPCVVTCCGGPIAATVDTFALALCGHDDVAVYDGGLMEWSADPPMTDPGATCQNPAHPAVVTLPPC